MRGVPATGFGTDVLIRVRGWFCALALAAGVSPVQGAGVVFSELMYHPVEATNAPTDGEEYEFLELHNPDASPVALGGATFSSGITFTFPAGVSLPAGAYGVLVRNLGAFTSRYSGVTNVLGTYGGALANGGETVTLTKSDNTTLFSVTYRDAAPWPEAADGWGPSLVLTNLSGAPDDPAAWAAGDAYLGTPGRAGGAALRDIVINEALTHTDLPAVDSIELHNRSTGSVSIAGWYLSDDPVLLRKYRITNAAPVAAGGYVIFTHVQFDNTNAPGANTPFSLSELGDRAVLTAADAQGHPSRHVDFVEFEAADNGVSFGRHPNGDGDWVTLATPSLGSANGPPRNGPVVISEIMYHPPNDDPALEYLELMNVSAGPVPLFDPAHPTNTWRLTGAVDLALPTNLTLAAGQRLLAVGTANVAAFRSAYSLAATVTVVGTWSGRLDNGGESVRCYKPGSPEPDGFVPYVLVDRVNYGDAAPWPAAPDGNGPSLERIVVTDFGNTASNWFAGAPGGSPGAAASGLVNPCVIPSPPPAGQSLTVTVAVVAQSLPTQVVLRTSIGGVTTTRTMTHAGGQTYDVTLPAQADGTWVHYQILAYAGGQEVFRWPPRETRYLDAPALTVSMNAASGNPSIAVRPTPLWTSHAVSGLLTDNTLTLFLDSAGEALVDDVVLEDANGVNHVRNGGFSDGLAFWALNGNHAGSYSEAPAAESGNAALHMVFTGAALAWDNVGQNLSPEIAVGTLATLRFRTRAVSVVEEQWAWFVVGTAAPEPLINEIMYHPDWTNELEAEFVELFNPTGGSVDLSGWTLNGAGLTFPGGTTLAAGGYLVCGASAAALQRVYGVTPAVGGWKGSLDNGGETLELRNAYGRPVDAVAYGDNEPWPSAADGYGPSLERLTATGASSAAAQWGSSAASTNWHLVTWTGEVSTVNAGVRLFLEFDGKCWIDDVSVKAVGSTNELVLNGAFENGMTGWTATNNHALSRVEAGMGRTGAALALVGNASRRTPPELLVETILYGDAGSNTVRSAPLATAAGTEYVVRWWVKREGLGAGVCGVLGTVTGRVSLACPGTPGRANSEATSRTPVGIAWVSHDAALGAVGTANVVRARLAVPGSATNVRLAYREVSSNTYEFSDEAYSTAPMCDDGFAPDATAGDGEFAAYGPVVAAAWRLVRYHVEAVGTNGFVTSSPRADDPGRDYAYWVPGTAVQTHLPNWHLMVDGDPVIYPFVRRACAVSPNGQAFTDVMVRHRGRTSSSANGSARTGIALRLFRSRRLDAWFANNQEGINFRNRMYEGSTDYTRVVNEQLGYDLQYLLGFPTPRTRYACLWINGAPSITVELEDPEEDFLKGNGIDLSDYVSRVGWTGRRAVGGDLLLDNFEAAKTVLGNAAPAGLNDAVRVTLDYEAVQHGLALLALTANGDQFIDWNMFQHRRAVDGRWWLYPWDADMSFRTDQIVSGPNTNRLPELHPYYQSPLHPSIWDKSPTPSLAYLPGKALFHPESGAGAQYTLPYRHRQQVTLWRYLHTIGSTNVLFAKLDGWRAALLPAFTQLGLSSAGFSSQIATTKTAIVSRRNFLFGGNWSDKEASLWAATNVYVPTNVIINEIMHNPAAGGEYLELYNPSRQAVDLSGWLLTAGAERYRLPFGAMLGPTSYVVIAETATALTNAFATLSDSATLVRRYPSTPIWDWPIVFTSATEYASRVIEVPSLTLPGGGIGVTLYDLCSNVIDQVAYGVGGVWPADTGTSLELADPRLDNGVAGSWRACVTVGTPGALNSVVADVDGDGMPDAWEQQIVDASPVDPLTNSASVLPGDDFDNDRLSNFDEYRTGTNPTTNDAAALLIWIEPVAAGVRVDFDTMAATGAHYDLYSARLYDLEYGTNLLALPAWSGVSHYTNLVGDGQTVFYTNTTPGTNGFYRYGVRLQPRR